MKNTFGISVYSKEYIFPDLLLFSFPETDCMKLFNSALEVFSQACMEIMIAC
jgi:hypothetical protein